VTTHVRIQVSAENLAAFWAVPVERAIADMTGVAVDIDRDDDIYIATIGTVESATLVVDLPPKVNAFLDARWNGEGDGEPFEFDLALPDWLVDLVRASRPAPGARHAVLAAVAPESESELRAAYGDR